ncbi:MAG: glycosyltransferase [Bergeyella sp.]|nr:glycosyltransferase [Bergeyella sp.]
MKNKKIKVLFRNRSLEMGGVERVLLGILNNMNSKKFDCALTLDLYQGELREQIPAHVHLSYLAKGKEDIKKHFFYKILLVLRRIKLFLLKKIPVVADRWILHNNADIEVAMTYSTFETVLRSPNKKSKKIGWFHSDITVPKLQPRVPKILEQIPKFDYLIWCSQQTKDIFIKTYPTIKLPENKVIVNAIPIEEIKKRAEEFIPDFGTDETIFVSVGRLHSRKGYHTLMESHKRLITEGFFHKILIIGNGEEKENLEKQIRSLGVEQSFILLGSKSNPFPYVKKANFFILSSESEAWPLAIAEALILQKPTIATDVGGIREMIEHKKNGYLVPYSTEGIYHGIKTFLTDKTLISSIRKELEYSESRFDNEKIFQSIENVFIGLTE